LAFSTIQGSGGAPDSFVGTSGVDSIVLVNSDGNYFLGAQQAGDNITFQTTGNVLYDGVVSNATIKGGQGTDTLTWNTAVGANTFYSSAFVNGNSDRDTITTNALDTFLTSTIHGGAANDTLTLNSALTSSVVNGNKGIDTIVTANVINGSTVFGGGGGDLITLGAAPFTNSTVSGDLGNDAIAVNTAGNSLNNSTFQGGDGVDSIIFTGTGAANDVVYINGNDGIDTLTLAAGHAATSTTIEGGVGDDIITTGGAAVTNLVTVVGGEGADTITAAGADAVRVIYNGTNQGGASASVVSNAVAAVGDTITGLDMGAVAQSALTFSAAALNGTGSALDAAGAWDMNAAGVYNAAGVDFNLAGGTATYAQIAAAATAVFGTVTGDLGDIGYIVFGGPTAAASDAAIVQVTLGSTKANAALNAADQVAIYAIGGAGTAFDGTVNFIA